MHHVAVQPSNSRHKPLSWNILCCILKYLMVHRQSTACSIKLQNINNVILKPPVYFPFTNISKQHNTENEHTLYLLMSSTLFVSVRYRMRWDPNTTICVLGSEFITAFPYNSSLTFTDLHIADSVRYALAFFFLFPRASTTDKSVACVSTRCWNSASVLSEQLPRPCSTNKHDQLKAYNPLCDVFFLKTYKIYLKEIEVHNSVWQQYTKIITYFIKHSDNSKM